MAKSKSLAQDLNTLGPAVLTAIPAFLAIDHFDPDLSLGPKLMFSFNYAWAATYHILGHMRRNWLERHTQGAIPALHKSLGQKTLDLLLAAGFVAGTLELRARLSDNSFFNAMYEHWQNLDSPNANVSDAALNKLRLQAYILTNYLSLASIFVDRNFLQTGKRMAGVAVELLAGKAGKKKETLEEKAAKLNPRATSIRATKLLDKGDYDGAFGVVSEFFDREQIRFSNSISEYLTISDLQRLEKKSDKTIEDYFYLMIYYAVLEDHSEDSMFLKHADNAIEIADQEDSTGLMSAELKFFKGQYLDNIGSPLAEENLLALVDYVFENEIPIERFGESANPVFVFEGGKFIKKNLILKAGRKVDIESEVRVTKDLEQILEGEPDIGVPRILFSGEYDVGGAKNHVLLMKQEHGTTVYKMLNKGRKDEVNLDRIARAIAIGHAHLESSYTEQLRIDLKTQKKLQDIGASPALRERIMQNYSPVVDYFNQRGVFGFNLDAHPENFFIQNNNKTKKLDNEDKGRVPLQFDLVNFLEYGDFFTEQEKKDFIEYYLRVYKEQSGRQIDRDDFMLGYYNAVIVRAIDLSGAWSSPARSSLWGRRRGMLEKARDAIASINELCEGNDFGGWFDDEKRIRYEMLDEALEELMEYV
ncbi:hypothetical protein JW868_03890 [Candidatus Woesearchaeota archaeon]|nr:hypothetical protein [Candidatus Woesearchaeota archaeon]